MIQESEEKVIKIGLITNATDSNTTKNQQFELYQQATTLLKEECTKEQIPRIAYQLLKNIKIKKLFRAILSFFLEKNTGKGASELQHTIVAFIKECLDSKMESEETILQKSKLVMELLLESKGNILEKVVQTCKESQPRSKNMLLAVNEVLIKKIKQESAVNLNFTFTTLLALKIVQYGQKASSSLMEEALRHLLIVDLIQRGDIMKIITENDQILSSLLTMLDRPSMLNGYLFCMTSKFSQKSIETKSQLSPKIAELQQKSMQLILKTVQKDKQLTQQIYTILHSKMDIKEQQKRIQLIRSYCIFTSEYSRKQIQEGILEEKIIKLIEQLMGIKDFLSFEHLVIRYAEIAQINETIAEKLQSHVIERIQRNCLPSFKNTELITQDATSKEIMFLSNSFENQYKYYPSSTSSDCMKFLLDKILQERGCKPKPKICPCFDSYIHHTIETQYDQQFNEHDFMSASNLMCRQIHRVKQLNPQVSQLQKLKEYLINNIKWLLNLNESCQPHYRRCINFKIFDLILAFPYILNNNQFLQQVTEDLLLDRIPETFYHISCLIQFYQSEQTLQNAVNLERIGQKLIKKASVDSLTLLDKANIWNMAIIIWKDKENKLKELLELYSLHEDHWMAKYCAFKHRKLSIIDSYETKIEEIKQRWCNCQSFFSDQLTVIKQWLKSK